MIASLRGLIVLAVVAALLAVLVLVVGPARSTIVDRRVWLGAEPKELVITYGNEPPVTLTKRDNRWEGRFDNLVADPATVDGILTALRARWHRSGSLHAGQQHHGSLRIGDTTFEIGDPLPGSEQTWIYRNGRALLVDNWIAKALVPSPLELRVRRPFANLRDQKTINVHGIARLSGTFRSQPTPMWLAPELVERFYNAAEAIELVSLGGNRGEKGFTISYGDTSFGENAVGRIGTCGDRILITTPQGDGCVDAAAWNALEAAARALTEPVPDKRPIPFTPSKILFGGGILDFKSHDFDRDRLRELRTALQTPGEIVPRTGKPIGSFSVDGVITLEIFKDGVAREGEPVMIRTPLIDIINRPVAAYRDTTRWREDALTIQSITVDGKTFKRGAVIGEWIGATQPGRVEALAAELSTVRAPDADKAVPAKHHIAVTFAPPTGEATTHTIEIGANCTGRIDGKPAMVPADLCTAVDGLQ